MINSTNEDVLRAAIKLSNALQRALNEGVLDYNTTEATIKLISFVLDRTDSINKSVN